MESSAKDNVNIFEVFYSLAKDIKDKIEDDMKRGRTRSASVLLTNRQKSSDRTSGRHEKLKKKT